MTWRVDFSPRSLMFLKRNALSEDSVLDKIKLALRKFQGEEANINLKKLKGEWQGFYRIRSGRLRIIVEFDFELRRAYIEAVDWRGNAYSK